jgi:hypothetical protein
LLRQDDLPPGSQQGISCFTRRQARTEQFGRSTNRYKRQ